LADGIFEAPRLGRSFAEVIPPSADAMDFLGQVDDLEIGGKPPRQGRRLSGREAFEEGHELAFRCRVRFPTPDGGAPGGFHCEIEVLAPLVPEHLADESAEHSNVLSERNVLGREECPSLSHAAGSDGKKNVA
jgi:hypothetical protein